jgi:hypothetical protein
MGTVTAFFLAMFLLLDTTNLAARTLPAESGNLLRNGGFEVIDNIGLDSATVDGWRVKGRKRGIIRQDCCQSMFGNKSLKLSLLELPEQGNWEIYQDIPGTSFQKNSQYRFTGWMQSYKGSSAFEIRLRKDGTVVKTISLEAWNGQDHYLNGTDFLKYETVFDTEDSDALQIACILKNDPQFLRDTAWFDGLVLATADKVNAAKAPKAPFPKTLFVDTKSSPGGSGTRQKPYPKIQMALNQAGPGTTIHVAPGIYTETLTFMRGGRSKAPLILRGGNGVRLQGAKPEKLTWKPVPEWGAGVYKTPSPIGFVRGVYYSEKHRFEGLKLPLIRYERAGDDARKPDHPYHYRNVFKNGIITKFKQPGQGFDVLIAVAMYNPEDRCIYLRFGDNRDPNPLRFRLVKGTSLIDIDSVDHVVVENLELHSAVKGVLVRRARTITVRNCRFQTIEYGIGVKFSDSVILANNILTLGACHATNPHRQVISTPTGPRYQNDVWRAFKWVGYYDRSGINLHKTTNSQVYGNYIHDHWDGIGVGRQSTNVKIHHNCITNISDDGLTVQGDTNQEWYGNTVSNSFANLRYWHNPHNKGPVYIYGNRFSHGRQDNIRFMNDTDMSVYVYHNTTIGGDGIRYHRQKTIGTPNLHLYNNRFLGDFFGMTGALRRAKFAPTFKSGYNTYLADPEHVIEKYDLNPHGYCGTDNVGKGVDLSTHFGKPLPGCPLGYFKGDAPDCGASGLNLD